MKSRNVQAHPPTILTHFMKNPAHRFVQGQPLEPQGRQARVRRGQRHRLDEHAVRLQHDAHIVRRAQAGQRAQGLGRSDGVGRVERLHAEVDAVVAPEGTVVGGGKLDGVKVIVDSQQTCSGSLAFKGEGGRIRPMETLISGAN